jgi:hypothetical protein
MCNPEKDGGSSGHPKVTAGVKVMCVIGMYMSRSQAKNPVANVHLTCLEDRANNGEESYDLWESLTLTQRAMWKVANFALAVGHTEPFDVLNEDKLREVLMSNPVVVTVVMEKDRKGNPRPKAFKVEAYEGEVSTEWDAIAKEGEQRHQEMRQRMLEKGNGGGSKRSRSSDDPGYDDAPPAGDEDIPFALLIAAGMSGLLCGIGGWLSWMA